LLLGVLVGVQGLWLAIRVVVCLFVISVNYAH